MPRAAACLCLLLAGCSAGQPGERRADAGEVGHAPPSRSADTGAAAPSSDASERGSLARVCATVELRSVRVGERSYPLSAADTLQDAIEIVPASTTLPATTIVATGPVLGSMDSRDMQASTECTTGGAAVTVMLTRSADFVGGVKKDVLWRPTLTIDAAPAPAATVRVVWRMRLTTGREVARAQTPPYQELAYPRTLQVQVGQRR